MSKPASDYRLLDVKGVARLLGIHSQTVRKMVKKGQLPPSVILGKRSRRWRYRDVVEWAEGRFQS